MADVLVAGDPRTWWTQWHVEPFVEHPEHRTHDVPRAPLPDRFDRVLPASRSGGCATGALATIARGATSRSRSASARPTFV